MNIALALVLALATALGPATGAAPGTAGGTVAPTTSGPEESARTSTGSGTAGATPAAGAGPAAPEVSVEELDVVVPAVASAPFVVPRPSVRTDAGDDVVVVDRPAGARRVESGVVDAEGFQTVGLTWPDGTDVTGLAVEVRSRVDGVWTGWTPLEVADAPDPGSPDAANAARGGTDPLAVGDVDAVQLAVAAAPAGAPDGLSLTLVGSEEVPVPAAVAVAPALTAGPPAGDVGAVPGDAVVRTAAVTSVPTAAAPTPPRVITRTEWGAPAPVCAPDVAGELVGAVVHHTAGSNAYTTVAQAMQQLRNDAAYHITGRGWCDLGYNFVVDKWGNLYEGRAGSVTEPVIGVHAGGFNAGMLGVSMLGTYGSRPSAATQRTVADVIGWRLGAYDVDPRGTMLYTTATGENSRYANETVRLPRVLGHRDVAFTACPGDGGYAALPGIRAMAAEAAAAGWPTPLTNLVRTATNGTVYLVSGSVLHPIASLDLLVALTPLGRVSIVSDAYLTSRRPGPAMRRVVLAPDGTVYFVDAGIRLPFGSCAQVVDFGFSCGQAIPLEANQIAKLYPGPPMSNLYRTTSGKAFWVTDGTRREVSDTAALVAAGLPTGSVTLLESGIGYLPLAAPVTRDGQVLRSRTTATTVLSAGGRYTPLPGGLDATPGIASLPSAALDEASLARLPLATALHPVIKDSTTARVYLLTTTGKVHLTDPTPVPATPPTTTSAVLARIPDAGTASTPVFVKSPTNATVNYLHAGQRRPIGSWTDLVGLNNGGPTPVIHTLPGTATTLLTPGPTQVAPGTLIKSPDNGTVYLTHGTGSRITVTSFTTTTELGATRLVTLPTADVNRYTLTPGTLTTAIACGPARYLALSGRLHPLTPTTATAYAITTYTTLDPTTCTALPRTTQPLGRFLATPDGTIYHVTHGTKHPISSWTTYLTLGGTPTTTTPITHQTAARFPTGPTR